MTIYIVEDEPRAAKRLQRLVQELRPQAQVPPPAPSIAEARAYLENHPHPEAILLDIELADGHSFELLDQVALTCPVIFCTAFDQYALEAFRYHGLDYLLKPIKKEELATALDRARAPLDSIDYHRLAQAVHQPRYQERLLVKLGQRYRTVEIKQIAYFFTQDKVVYARLYEGKDVPLDQSLEHLQNLLDPRQFYRINRQMIVQLHALDNMYAWSRARLKLELKPPFEEHVIVATDRAADFKRWLEGRPSG